MSALADRMAHGEPVSAGIVHGLRSDSDLNARKCLPRGKNLDLRSSNDPTREALRRWRDTRSQALSGASPGGDLDDVARVRVRMTRPHLDVREGILSRPCSSEPAVRMSVERGQPHLAGPNAHRQSLATCRTFVGRSTTHPTGSWSHWTGRTARESPRPFSQRRKNSTPHQRTCQATVAHRPTRQQRRESQQ